MTRRPKRGDVGRLYDEFGAPLYRYALMILADPSAAADAVQQVFLQVLRGSATNAIDSGDRYLVRAVRNECFSLLRRTRRERMHAEPLVEPIGDDDPELRLTVEAALRSLPPEQREVVHLKVFEGLTFQEIAGITGESINTVASRYRYAIDKMRAHMPAGR